MSKWFHFTSLSILVAIGLILTGCSEEQPSQQPSASPEEDAFAELSPEDRALAEKQKTCPVSGDPLGSMGKPYKVTIQGRDILLCCLGCKAQIEENPEQYLANLPE